MDSNRIEIVEMARYLANGEHFFLEYNDADVFISPHLHRFIEIELITDGSGYEARFSRCGICTLMNELGLYDLVPAMCHLDYTMAEAGGACDFVRQYTLASGGPYCDCGYRKKTKG